MSEAGTKHDATKPRLDLLSPIALIEVSKVLSHGAEKYGEQNWRGGLRYSRLLGAMLRHTFAFLSGESKDPETGISHMAHAACCAMFLLEFEATMPSMDDRYKTCSDVKINMTP